MAIETKYQMTSSEMAGGAEGQKAYYSRIGQTTPTAPSDTWTSASGVTADQWNSGDRTPEAVRARGSANLNELSVRNSPIPGATPTTADVASARSDQYHTQDPVQAEKDRKAELLAAAQDRINTTQSLYQTKLQDELAALKPEQEQAMGRTNALSALMGLGGSSSADARTGAQGARSAEQNRLTSSKVNAEKIAALDAIYAQIDNESAKTYDAQLKTNKDNQKKLLDDVAASGVANLQGIAGQLSEVGKTFDDWKTANPDYYDKISNNTGKTEYELRTEWEKAIPAEYKTVTGAWQKSRDASGNTLMTRSIYDPVKKTSKMETYVSPVPYTQEGKVTEMKNGDLMMIMSDGTGKLIKAYTPTELEKSTTAKNYADANMKGQTLSQITEENYDKAKLEATTLFNSASAVSADKKVPIDTYKEVRARMPAGKKDDFDRWARDAGFISPETMKQMGVLPKTTGDQAIDSLKAILGITGPTE